MHTRFVGALIVALFAPLCVQADTGSASSTPAPVTYNPDTRPGNPYVTGNDGYRKKQSRHHRKCGNCR